MESILVGMDGSEATVWAAIHAVNLAKRMNVRVSILLILQPEMDRNRKNWHKPDESTARRQVEAFIDESRSEGVVLDYYITRGTYEDEILRFIQENATSLLVLGFPQDTGKNGQDRLAGFLKTIRNKTDCRIEVVRERPSANVTKRR